MNLLKKKVLIFHRSPFGASTDWYYLSVFGLKYFVMTMLCMSNGKDSVDNAGVHVKYINNKRGRLSRAVRMFSSLRQEANSKDYDVIIIPFFHGCWLIPLLLWHQRNKLMLDIRTGDVNKNKWKSAFNNWLLRMTTHLYTHVSILSLDLGHYLNLPFQKLYYLPLGGITMDCGQKKFDKLSLFYVGTFLNRDLDKVIRAVATFRNLHGEDIEINLMLIGDGPGIIREELTSLAQELKVDDICKIPGFVHRSELTPYMQNCNIGLSFIPMTPAYEFQPPTKTYEYILAGMPVIATKTFANKQVVSKENGILCEDSTHSLVKAFEKFYQQRKKFDSKTIRDSLRDYDWKNIVDNNFAPIIKQIASHEDKKCTQSKR